MKKIICFLLTFTMLFALCSCGKQAELNKEIAELKSMVENLQKDYGETETEILNLRNKVEDGKDLIDSVELGCKNQQDIINQNDYEISDLINQKEFVIGGFGVCLMCFGQNDEDHTITLLVNYKNLSGKDMAIAIPNHAKKTGDIRDFITFSLGTPYFYEDDSGLAVDENGILELKQNETIRTYSVFTFDEKEEMDVYAIMTYWQVDESGVVIEEDIKIKSLSIKVEV